ncbi:MAG: isoleucine--tRNA ligase [Pseudopedobacter saltans]|uniref:Isoleucine--tRNA ligase n=1 Tax=Pseudopedobacter saltans TaxID=151895 RepID=A0A2W5GJ47_9SPHI|nr:MAG: isoleucine--tRNA ligase [Pseudopedobacter saltans]
MSSIYREFSNLNLPDTEKEVLQSWQDNGTFEKSIELREGAPSFVFYEGPPSANGMPGIHHVMARTIKDLFCRYKTMQGFQVKRKAGWDTHGLPVELGVEKELGITKDDIGHKISVEDYNKKCREAVLRYKDKWDELTTKMGYWVDLDDPYITFKNDYIETLWWLLKKMYDKGLLYQSISIQPYSAAAGTGLSSHELNMPGTYWDEKDTTLVAMFKAVKDAKTQFLFDAAGSGEVFFMAWTTTPWTLPSNLALTVGPKIDYVLIKTFNPYTHLPVNVVMAKALIFKYFSAEGENGDFENYNEGVKLLPWKIVAEFKGADIIDARYEQLMPFEANTIELSGGDPFKVIGGDFVTTEDGTGIVHTAPAFGADDFKVGQKNNIGILILVDKTGKFVDGVGAYSGRYVKDFFNQEGYTDVNVDIAVDLKLNNRAFKVEKYVHSYPHCWRTDKPVLYYPLESWFIKTTALRERMVELNKTVNWKPKATGEGRFGNWLENMVDWNLSRSRFWGTPLPIWKTEDGSEELCIGSVEQLKEEIAKAGDLNSVETIANIEKDLHKPYVDRVILLSPSGKPMKRIPDLVDVWFDSGAMPFAQWHFPFENQDIFAKNYPADFISEGVDQTRGWFYTLHAISSLLKEEIQEELRKNGVEVTDEKYPGLAFRTVVSNGLVLDKNGNKMSKRLGNAVDPFKTLDEYGADATRWYMMTNASPWDNLKFDIDGIKEVTRKFFGTLYNTYQFFILYANVDGFNFSEKYIPISERPEIDRWILSSLNTLIQTASAALDDYEPTLAGRAVEEFLDEHLSNWYVRLCRRRFWKGEYEADKISAYQTLFECLETITRLIAPISPFFSDELFKRLNEISHRFDAASVHHVDYPKANLDAIDKDLEERMQLAQDASSLILSIRKKVNIKVRQPLQKVMIPVLDAHMKTQLDKIEDLIKSEVNVKEIEYLEPNNSIISKKAKPNFKTLGARMGKSMKAVGAAINAFTPTDIAHLEAEGKYVLDIDGQSLEIHLDDVVIAAEDIPGWSVASKGALTVALDIQLSKELEQEGIARELVNRIQNIRKDNKYDLTDRILVTIVDNPLVTPAINTFKSYICSEILADSLEVVDTVADGTEIDINGSKINISVQLKG